MKSAIIREVEAKDIPAIKNAINDVWPWSDLIQDKKTLDATLGMYLNQVLFEATFGRVAVLNDEVVGVIFGIVNDSEPKYRMLLEDSASHTLTLLGASDTERKGIYEYFSKITLVYEQLNSDPDKYDGTLDFLVLTNAAQGFGIGKSLWLALKAYFKEHNAKSIYLYSDDECNFGFYEHQGFRRTGEQKTAFNFDGEIFESGIFLYEYKF